MIPAHLQPDDLDRADPLAPWVEQFIRHEDVVAYLDGNSLGRPMVATQERFARFVDEDWGGRLIRSWDEQWMELPTAIGDRIGATLLGAAAGQVVVADSTTVLLYKAIRAALGARSDRDEIVIDDDQFPTDRFVVEGIAREHGATIRWVHVDPSLGVTAADLRGVVGPRTAVVLINHVSYRSAYIADMPGLTTIAHDAGALVVWDLCHSVGVVPMELDAWSVDLAVGCTYKFLNGGPGAPAFLFARADLQEALEPPVQGWMGAEDVFSMADRYRPAPNIRRFVSGTPPVTGMLAMQDMLDALGAVGIDAVRAKSTALTEYTIRLADELLAPFGVEVVSPRDADLRGSHVMLRHPDFREVVARLWERGIIPDFRNPDGLRVGLSPLSTTFAEAAAGIDGVRDALASGGRAD